MVASMQELVQRAIERAQERIDEPAETLLALGFLEAKAEVLEPSNSKPPLTGRREFVLPGWEDSIALSWIVDPKEPWHNTYIISEIGYGRGFCRGSELCEPSTYFYDGNDLDEFSRYANGKAKEILTATGLFNESALRLTAIYAHLKDQGFEPETIEREKDFVFKNDYSDRVTIGQNRNGLTYVTEFKRGKEEFEFLGTVDAYVEQRMGDKVRFDRTPLEMLMK